MTYEQKLTFQLRLRGQSEAEIAEILREIRAHELEDSETEATVFGAPEVYAENFEKRKRRTVGSAIVTGGAILAVISFIAYVVVGLAMKNDGVPELGLNDIVPSWVVSVGVVGMIGVATLVGFLVDYVRPVSVDPESL